MSRADVPRDQRPDFCLYVDEFQNYSTDSFAEIMSEARKFGLNLIVANQFTTQLTDEVRDAVFGNIGTVVALRVGIADAEFLAKQFAPAFDVDDLQRIPNGNAAVRTMIHGVPTQPFSMAGLPPLNVDNKELADALKQLSAAKYGRPKAVVDKEITARIILPTDAKKGAEGAAKPTKPSTGSSFLDDWLTKKENNSFKTPASPFANNQQPQQQPSNQAVLPQQNAPVASAQPTSAVPAGVPAVDQPTPSTVIHPQNQQQQFMPQQGPQVPQQGQQDTLHLR